MPTHITHGEVKFGRLRTKRSRFALPLSNYLRTLSVPYPPVHAWERPIEWGMLGNDSVGDCVIAGALHLIMGWKAVADNSRLVNFSTADALALYSAITGYDPNDPNTDRGTNMTDALNYWQQTGMMLSLGTHKVAGYTSLDISNIELVKAATYIFGGAYIGFSVPNYIMNVPAGGDWSEPPNADTSIIGGHCVYCPGYGHNGTRCVSWGSTYTFDWNFWAKYVEEAYAIVSGDWLTEAAKSPTGLDLSTLLADLKSL